MNRVELVLPGRWWHVPLETAGTVESSVKAMAREIVGAQDDRAGLRAQIRERVSRAAEKATRAGGTDFYFAIEVVPGVPVPATLTVAWVPSSSPALAAVDQEAAAQELMSTLGSQDAESVLEMWDDREHTVVRSVRRRVKVAEEEGLDDQPQLAATYWLLRATSSSNMVLDFRTPMAEVADAAVTLFDAIVGSVSWPEAEPA